MTDHHRAGCEDEEYYYCSDCYELVHQSKLNQCPVCLRFIPRMHSCICDKLPPVAPDWDWIRKERLENPEGG
jgi:hypothetical protein